MKTRILCIFVVILAVAGMYCGWRYYSDVVRPEMEISAADSEQNELFSQIKPVTVTSAVSTTVLNTETAAVTAETVTETDHLADAAKINSSVVGWITIPDTHIGFPIAQADDNDFYLHNGFDKKYNYELGCPFLDYRCASDFSGFNSIVYAHHMTEQRMFADIALFKDSAFMVANPVGHLTLHDGVHTVRFFAYLRTCPHRVNVRIFRHNFVGGKAKIRRRAVALQGFLTKPPAKFDEKTCMNPYVDRI